MQEIERHRSEVREWIRRRVEKGKVDGVEWLRKVLKDIEKRRGEQAAQRLKDDISQQWQRGNRGALGDWRNE